MERILALPVCKLKNADISISFSSSSKTDKRENRRGQGGELRGHLEHCLPECTVLIDPQISLDLSLVLRLGKGEQISDTFLRPLECWRSVIEKIKAAWNRAEIPRKLIYCDSSYEKMAARLELDKNRLGTCYNTTHNLVP
ncbi:hypothetical protein J6590_097246 [Homalodisca vitripennis]|nr:hypothetical protein J6590_097246 [Homalodisca vitripennis]